MRYQGPAAGRLCKCRERPLHLNAGGVQGKAIKGLWKGLGKGSEKQCFSDALCLKQIEPRVQLAPCEGIGAQQLCDLQRRA